MAQLAQLYKSIKLSFNEGHMCSKEECLEMTVFWDIAPYNIIEVGRRLRGAYYVSYQGDDDGGSQHLWNVGLLLRH
jgi:hypothetical protein